MRRSGRSVPPEISVRRPLWAGTPFRCSCCPPTVSPLAKVRSPPSDFHSVGPLDDRHGVVAVLIVRTLPSRCGNPGHIRLQIGLPARRQRQKGSAAPFSPPGGDWAPGWQPEPGAAAAATPQREDLEASHSPGMGCPGDPERRHEGGFSQPIPVQGSLMTSTLAATHFLARSFEVQFERLADPFALGGDRTTRLFLLHPAPAAKGPGGPRRPRARATTSAMRSRPSAGSSAPSWRSTETATPS